MIDLCEQNIRNRIYERDLDRLEALRFAQGTLAGIALSLPLWALIFVLLRWLFR